MKLNTLIVFLILCCASCLFPIVKSVYYTVNMFYPSTQKTHNVTAGKKPLIRLELPWCNKRMEVVQYHILGLRCHPDWYWIIPVILLWKISIKPLKSSQICFLHYSIYHKFFFKSLFLFLLHAMYRLFNISPTLSCTKFLLWTSAHKATSISSSSLFLKEPAISKVSWPCNVENTT